MFHARLDAVLVLALCCVPGSGLSSGLAAQDDLAPAGIDRPTLSSDGRLACSTGGEIWIVQGKGGGGIAGLASGKIRSADTEWRQVTRHAADDRDPAWSPDGKSIVFASDRSGSFDLYRIELDGDARSKPEKLTGAAEPDREPSAAADGSIVFRRGDRSAARLMIRKPDGKVARLTKSRRAERSPRFSPDGKSVVFVADGDRQPELRIYTLPDPESDSKEPDRRDRVVLATHAFQVPTWGPKGEQIVFSVAGRNPGVFVTNTSGGYTNLVSRAAAAATFSPSGEHLLLAALQPRGPGYNGDPDRVMDRRYEPFGDGKRELWVVPAPRPPDGGRSSWALQPPRSAAARVAAFDRLVQRLAERYRESDAARLHKVAADLRDRVRSAETREDYEAVVFELLQRRPPFRRDARGRAVVSSAHPAATAAGVEILAKGGNVVDAAIAVSFALGVVEPDASGIGGYGEMLVFLKGMKEPVCIEFMTRVPGAAVATPRGTTRGGGRTGRRAASGRGSSGRGASGRGASGRGASGRGASGRGAGREAARGGSRAATSRAATSRAATTTRHGAQRVNVPGVVAGMGLAFRRFKGGKLEWKDLVAPAAKLATDGFVIDDAFATTLNRNQSRFFDSEGSKALFFPNGRALRAGDHFKNPDLGWTLQEIADHGADAFYKGEVAKKIVADLRSHGSVIQSGDFSNYFAVARPPVQGTYRGYTVYSGAPPVSGGATLVGKLTTLEQESKIGSYLEDANAVHAMIEAWKLAPRTSGRIADPSLWPVDVAPFSDKEAARKRWEKGFKKKRSLTPAALDRMRSEKVAGGVQGILDARLLTGTTAFVVADAAGNMVAVTQTLGTWGGNFHVSDGLGFLYNDKYRGASSNPSRFGASVPLSRIGTVIAPTLLFRGENADQTPFAALGAAGNSWISAAVYQMVCGLVDQKLGAQQVIELPRFLVGGRRVQVEDGFAPGVLRKLDEMGHGVQRISLRGELRMGYAAVAVIDEDAVTAGADPRRSGAAGSVR